MANDGLVTDPELFPCWDPAVTSFPPLPVVSPGPKYFFEGKNGMLLLLAFQRAIARVCIVNKNEWLQTTKISYDGPAETPLWRHSLPSPLVSSGPKYFFEGKNGMLLLLAFQRAIARVCIVNKNEWLQTTKISYDGPAETPLWRHSLPSPLVSSGPKYFFEGKNGMLLLLAFQRAVACVCATSRSCYIKKTLFCG